MNGEDSQDKMDVDAEEQIKENLSTQDFDSEMDTFTEENKLNVSELRKIKSLYEGIKETNIPAERVSECNELSKLANCLLKYRGLLAETSPTAKLWLQYIEYVETLKECIRAERKGDWNLHLIAISKMLNLFAATGHINYAKSASLYLQLMQKLPNDHPWLYNCFQEQGFDIVRRSSRFWAGIWTDLTIEQVMMRATKGGED